jgi:hypothetical protein
MLPDDVLLEIFDFYVHEVRLPHTIQEWITLAHVCRRWRSVVFQSPHRLNLRLLCTPKTRVRDTLDIWPPFPLIIHHWDDNPLKPGEVDNIIAALEHNNRVCQIDLDYLLSPQLEYVTAAMNKPFPELTDLQLGVFDDKSGPILPDSFLGGTAPRLRLLILTNVPFPGLPNLLLSAIHLVGLSLYNIPPSGYIPPEAMATSLSALTSLVVLRIQFGSPRPRPALESQHPPPPLLTRAILPSLAHINFTGASEYLEVILARIDAPRLDDLYITYFNEIIFDTPQLFQFISRTPTLRALEKGRIAFSDDAVMVKFLSQTSDYGALSVDIPCTASGWQLSAAEQVCTSSLPLVSTLEDLYILEYPDLRPHWQDDVEDGLWLELLRPFVAVKNLYISKDIVPRVAPALEELVGVRTTSVLPTLESIFLEGLQQSGPLQKGIEMFVAARQLISHPVAVSRSWDPEQEQNEDEWYNDY